MVQLLIIGARSHALHTANEIPEIHKDMRERYIWNQQSRPQTLLGILELLFTIRNTFLLKSYRNSEGHLWWTSSHFNKGVEGIANMYNVGHVVPHGRLMNSSLRCRSTRTPPPIFSLVFMFEMEVKSIGRCRTTSQGVTYCIGIMNDDRCNWWRLSDNSASLHCVWYVYFYDTHDRQHGVPKGAVRSVIPSECISVAT